MSNRSITPLPTADFTPEMGNYRTLQPFRYWCQKVLPLVYDDSLSYYELLCKVVDYLNKTMEDVETLHGDVTNLHTAYEQLQNYVNTYFSSLDVQEEINNKLNDMANSGELTKLISPLLPALISNWLSENITPTTPVIDKTLSIENAAADSGMVGKLSLLSSGLNITEPTFDVNNCEPNRIYTISATCQNLPSGEVNGGILFSFARYNTSVDTYVQFFASANNKLYSRFKKYGGTWSSWYNYSDITRITDFDSSGLNITEPTFDVNNCEPNRIYTISATCQNLPSGEVNGGILFSFARYNTSVDTYVQFFASANNKLYSRFKKYGGTWSSWYNYSDITRITDFDSSGLNITEPTFDVNNCEPNRIYTISATCQNLPSGEVNGGILFSFARYNTSVDTYVQFFASANNKLYSRFKKYGGTWSSWYNYSDITRITDFDSSGLNITEPTFDVNNCEPNRIYTISATCQNLPSGEVNGGILFSFARYNTSVDTYVQFFASVNNKLYSRFKKYGGTWSSWYNYTLDDKVTKYFNLSMFSRIGVVGDSFASGVIFNGGDEIGTFYNISWVQQLCRKHGVTGVNFSTGGLTTRSWLTSTYGLQKLNAEEPCDLIYLCLGINDYYILGLSYLGVPDDISTKSDTFYGNYAKIIDNIISKNSKTRMILCTLAYTDNEEQNELIDAFNIAINNIAKHYNLPIGDLNKNGYFNNTFYNANKEGGHPNAVNYSGMSNAYEEICQTAMYENPNYFNKLFIA